jgi:hypothetical protein
MNQTNPHFTQWKNLTEEQKAEHDFENYSYEFQGYTEWFPLIKKEPSEDIVYRLVIEKDKYYTMDHEDHACQYVIKGKDITSDDNKIISLRPAKPSETNHNSQSWPVFIYNMYEAGKKEEAMLKVYENISNTLDNQQSIKRSIDTLPIELCSNELLVSFAMGLNVYLGKESKIRTQFCNRVKSFLMKESRMKKTLESIFA